MGRGRDGGGGGIMQEAGAYSECETAQCEAGGELGPGGGGVFSAFPQTFMNVICCESVAGVAVLEVLVVSGCRMELHLALASRTVYTQCVVLLTSALQYVHGTGNNATQ